MGERPKRKESSGDSTVVILALAGAAVLASKLGFMPDAGNAQAPGLSTDSIVSVHRAEQRFDCDLQEDASPTAEQIRCAQRVARSVGKTSFEWSQADGKCLNKLWHNESNWNSHADNPTSSAYGIPQALTRLHELPRDYEHNPVSQIRWGVKYIADRYEDPCNALDAWESRSPHWY